MGTFPKAKAEPAPVDDVLLMLDQFEKNAKKKLAEIDASLASKEAELAKTWHVNSADFTAKLIERLRDLRNEAQAEMAKATNDLALVRYHSDITTRSGTSHNGPELEKIEQTQLHTIDVFGFRDSNVKHLFVAMLTDQQIADFAARMAVANNCHPGTPDAATLAATKARLQTEMIALEGQRAAIKNRISGPLQSKQDARLATPAPPATPDPTKPYTINDGTVLVIPRRPNQSEVTVTKLEQS